MMNNTNKLNTMQTKNTVTFLQINIAGLSDLSKKGLDKYANDLKADVIAVAETKKDTSVDLNNYGAPFISETLKTNGKVRSGGTALYITDNATGTAQIKELEGQGYSSVWVLCIIKNVSYLIASVYVPHNDPEAMKEFLKSAEKASEFCKQNNVKYLNILGDLNGRHTAWGDALCNKHGNLMAEFVNENEDIYIAAPGEDTFLCKGGSSRIDLLLCNKSTIDRIKVHLVDEIYNLGSGAPSRGHLPVITIMNAIEDKNKASKKTVLDYKRTDWESWTAKVEEIFENKEVDVGNIKTADELWQAIKSALALANNKVIPKKTVCHHSKPFWKEELTIASLKVKYAAKMYQRDSSYLNSALLAKVKQEYSNLLLQSINEWMEEKAGELNNSKMITFWKKYKKYLCDTRKKSKIEIIKKEGSFIMTDEEKVQVFQDTFFTGKHLEGSNFDEKFFEEINAEIDREVSSKSTQESENEQLNRPFELVELDIALNKITATDKSPDNDEFHPLMLKKAGALFKLQLLRLANMVLHEEAWIWSESKVIFIKKDGKKTYAEAGSYRPLSINSYVGKLIERLLESRLRDHLVQNNILDEEQEGFQPGMSTTRYLYRLISQMTRFKQQKLVEICLLIDFEKAFDSVWINGLLKKLLAAGVDGKIWALLADMLTSRTVKLQINEFLSHKILCKVGIPQGSVLAPLLFIFFISDMPKTGNTDRFKYADDQSVLSVDLSAQKAHLFMQQYCDQLHQWCIKWRIKINCNKGKTEALVINRGQSDLPKLTIGSSSIEYVKESPVLGIILDEELSFRAHADKMKGRAVQKWWRVRRWCNRNWGLAAATITTLIKAMILPTILYAAPAWCHKIPNVYNNLWYDLMKTTCGAISKADLKALEIIAGIPPIDIQLQAINAKFMIKNYCQREDLLKTEMLLAEVDTNTHFIKTQMETLKGYVALISGQTSAHRIEINNVSNSLLKYSKVTMNRFQQKLWNSRLANAQEPIKNSLLKPPPAENFKAVKLNVQRSHESLILSMLHGHNTLNQFRYARSQTASPICTYCTLEEETENHLLNCSLTSQKHSYIQLEKICEEEGLKLDFTEIIMSRKIKPIHQLGEYIKDIVKAKPDLIKRKIYRVSKENKRCDKCDKEIPKGKKRSRVDGQMICAQCR